MGGSERDKRHILHYVHWCEVKRECAVPSPPPHRGMAPAPAHVVDLAAEPPVEEGALEERALLYLNGRQPNRTGWQMAHSPGAIQRFPSDPSK